MSTSQTGNQSSLQYFVLEKGRIKGPFAQQQLLDMHRRGRLRADSRVSTDRDDWFPLKSMIELPDSGVPAQSDNPPRHGELITVPPPQPVYPDEPQEVIPYQHAEQTELAPLANHQFFYSIDGDQAGPVDFAFLQQIATTGQLKPTDMIWYEGSPNWQVASLTQGLTFPGRTRQTSSFMGKRPFLVCWIALAILVAVAIPIYYTIAGVSDYEKRTREERAIVEQRMKEDKDRQANLIIALKEKEVELKREESELKKELAELQIREHEYAVNAVDSQVARKKHTENLAAQEAIKKAIDRKAKAIQENAQAVRDATAQQARDAQADRDQRARDAAADRDQRSRDSAADRDQRARDAAAGRNQSERNTDRVINEIRD